MSSQEIFAVSSQWRTCDEAAIWYNNLWASRNANSLGGVARFLLEDLLSHPTQAFSSASLPEKKTTRKTLISESHYTSHKPYHIYHKYWDTLST